MPLMVWWLFVLPIALAMPVIVVDQIDRWGEP